MTSNIDTRQLQHEIATAKAKIRSTEFQLHQSGKAVKTHKEALNRYKKEYQNLRKIYQQQVELNANIPKVSDHALIRFMERKMQIDFAYIKDEILEDEPVKEFLASNSKGEVTHSNGCRLVIENRTVITVLHPKS